MPAIKLIVFIQHRHNGRKLFAKSLGSKENEDWTLAMESVLILEGINITKTEAICEPDDGKVMMIDSSLYIYMKTETIMHSLCAKLKSLCYDSGFTLLISLFRNLIYIRLENYYSMTAFIRQLVDMFKS